MQSLIRFNSHKFQKIYFIILPINYKSLYFYIIFNFVNHINNIFMKHTLLFGGIIAICSFASCNSTPTSDNSTPKKDTTVNIKESKEENNKKTAMASMAAVNAHDVNGIFKDVAANFMEYQDGTTPAIGIDSAKKMIPEFFNSFPDMKGENQTFIADGNTVAVASDQTMTFKNDMGPMKATGKTAKYKDVDIFIFDDSGKIVSHRSIYPMAAFMMQVGVDMAKMQAMMDKNEKMADKAKK